MQMSLALNAHPLPAASNNPPVVKWFSCEQACGTVRHRLYVDGKETPYFIDVASHIAHYSYGSKIGLWGAGMGEEVRRRDDSTYRIAGFLGGFTKISEAKARAERRALGD
ncbi:MAG: hypothetical protein F8N36_13740 [Desulfovibrio sp.]|uniref:hypothetical protein n=1 Tax=Desulfovibrio sp. TaxID=885 RepID=UPI00135E1A0B|nr:hypothetical protein [Desulfovibrio sp.]MTJ93901.1 hypothetical protein [Desulfovibrio sp.]